MLMPIKVPYSSTIRTSVPAYLPSDSGMVSDLCLRQDTKPTSSWAYVLDRYAVRRKPLCPLRYVSFLELFWIGLASIFEPRRVHQTCSLGNCRSSSTRRLPGLCVGITAGDIMKPLGMSPLTMCITVAVIAFWKSGQR
jgi:hypothetical protein